MEFFAGPAMLVGFIGCCDQWMPREGGWYLTPETTRVAKVVAPKWLFLAASELLYLTPYQ